MLTEPEILTITDVLLHRGVEAVEESFKFLSTGKSEYVLVQPQNYVGLGVLVSREEWIDNVICHLEPLLDSDSE